MLSWSLLSSVLHGPKGKRELLELLLWIETLGHALVSGFIFVGFVVVSLEALSPCLTSSPCPASLTIFQIV